MTDRQFQQEEIERGEQWLAGVCVRSAEFNTARIKRAVRIAVEEQWLSENADQEAPAGLSARARQAVREALSMTRGDAAKRRRRPAVRFLGWIGTGLAAAAAIGIAIVGSRPTTLKPEETELNFATAFEKFQTDEELDQELNRLRDAFLELDQTVAKGWSEDLWGESEEDNSGQTEDGA